MSLSETMDWVWLVPVSVWLPIIFFLIVYVGYRLKTWRFPSLDGLLSYILLMRVPLIGLLAVTVLPWALFDSKLFGNLFVMERFWPLAISCAAGVVLTSSCLLTAHTIVRLMRFRFHVPHLQLRSELFTGALFTSSWPHLICSLILSFPLFFFLFQRHECADGNTAGFAILAGMAIGLCALFFGDFLQVKVFRNAWRDEIRVSGDHADRLVSWRTDGYCMKVDGKKVWFGAHIAALSFLITCAIIFVLGLRFGAPGAELYGQIPPLAYLLFAGTLLTLTLSGLTFFFDRFRIPLITVLVGIRLIAGSLINSEHVVRFERGQGPVQLANPVAVQKDKAEPTTAVLVCASGGGIQAAAWTAQVLTRLDQQIPGFAQRVGIMSGASGGSVGIMFYLQELKQTCGKLEAENVRRVIEASQTSSLQSVGWSLVFSDLPRLLSLTPATFRDRGWALQESWRLASHPYKDQETDVHLLDLPWSRWCDDVEEGVLPPFVFNTTIATSTDRAWVGRRLPISTVDIALSSGIALPDLLNRLRANGGDQHFDLSISTAARLSATFPYVTPIASAAYQTNEGEIQDLRTVSFADGGYCDNSGILSALNWLKTVRKPAGIQRLCVIRIEGFPANSDASRQELPPTPWHTAFTGPAQLLLQSWDASQRDHVNDVLNEVSASFGDCNYHPVTFRPGCEACATLKKTSRECHCVSPPLSWHLTAAEKRAIENGWAQGGNQSKVERLRDWLGN